MSRMKNSLLGSGLSVVIGTLLFTLANLVRDVAFASSFGTGLVADVFFLAMMIPVFIQTVVVASYKSTCIPIFGDIQERLGNKFLNEILIKLIKINFLLVLLAIAVIYLFSGVLSEVIAAKFNTEQKGMFASYIWMLLPMYGMASFAMLMEGELQRRNIFFRTTFPRVFLPLGMAVGAIMYGGGSQGVEYVVLGGTLGSFFHVLFIFGLLYKENTVDFSNRLMGKINYDFSDFRLQFFYLSMGTMIVYISPVIDQSMASYLGGGAVSTLSYAAKLAVGVASLTVGAISPVLLTFFSGLVSRDKNNEIKDFYTIYLILSIWVGMFVFMSIWFLSEPLISVLYERGDFNEIDVKNVSEVLKWSAVQIPPLIMSVAGFTLISAIKENKIFIPLNIMNILINVAGNFILMRYYGVPGIAMATAITYFFSLITMNLYLFYKKAVVFNKTLFIELFVCLLATWVVFYMVILFNAVLTVASNFKSFVVCVLLLLLFVILFFIKNHKIIKSVKKYKM